MVIIIPALITSVHMFDVCLEAVVYPHHEHEIHTYTVKTRHQRNELHVNETISAQTEN